MHRAQLRSLLGSLHPTDIAFIKSKVRAGLIDEIMQEELEDAQACDSLSLSDLQWKCSNSDQDITVSDVVKTKLLNGLKTGI